MTSRMVFDTKYGKIIRTTPQTRGTTVFCRLPYVKKPSPIDPNSNPQRRDEVPIGVVQRLAEKLMGRPEAPIKRRRRANSSGPAARTYRRFAVPSNDC